MHRRFLPDFCKIIFYYNIQARAALLQNAFSFPRRKAGRMTLPPGNDAGQRSAAKKIKTDCSERGRRGNFCPTESREGNRFLRCERAHMAISIFPRGTGLHGDDAGTASCAAGLHSNGRGLHQCFSVSCIFQMHIPFADLSLSGGADIDTFQNFLHIVRECRCGTLPFLIYFTSRASQNFPHKG